ncbi:hypothetical protein M0G43_07230 [Subsaxibacter sp. CAU 1640]|uniref:hypothetical protein n=1 Tax=Subsaxibacter sp. CAU 1640 TaxID=2933271 RepID=UPI0020049EF0|nr:hypothetical protein [Subsaxibacter sp. CAU 1640]MCK7590360.1 hypothetical protein [Subsaxibacter sp. CAU 1640]
MGLLIFACSSNDSPSDSSNFDSADYIYFMSGKINGEPFLFGQRVDATTLDYSPGLSNTLPAVCAYYPDTGGYNYHPFLYPNLDDENRPSIGMEFVRFHLCSDEAYQSETFNDKFPIGEYDFASSNEPSNGPTGKVGVNYNPIATQGPFYDTYGGDQTGSYFSIISSIPANSYILEVQVGTAQIIEGNFAVKLYNTEDSSDVITITDGRFKMIPSLQ